MGRIESRECGFDCLLGKRFKIVKFSTDLMENEIFGSISWVWGVEESDVGGPEA